MALRDIVERFRPREYPLDASVNRQDFARQRRSELVTDELRQCFADARHLLTAQPNDSQVVNEELATLLIAVNLHSIWRFVDKLRAADKELLSCLPVEHSASTQDASAQDADGEGSANQSNGSKVPLPPPGVSRRDAHLYAVVCDELRATVGDLEPSEMVAQLIAPRPQTSQ